MTRLLKDGPYSIRCKEFYELFKRGISVSFDERWVAPNFFKSLFKI